ncbi:hypothetical protein [Streptomyces sp. NPDC020965]|uniref:hypothetical protein n=1 Tax=Streptomyces sp. NPDC020965 TaxID=3365105 RepID=UPI0037B22EFA
MPTEPFTITPRYAQNHHPDSQGGGRADHTRRINGRTFYFERFWSATGHTAYRVRVFVPNPAPGIATGWLTIHELAHG